VQEAEGDATIQGNMFVPIDLLTPILNDLKTRGRRADAARPWLGVYPVEVKDQLVVSAVSKGGPGDRAGVKPGDVILEAGGMRPSGLAGLFRGIWDIGPAGVEVPLTIMRDATRVEVRVQSADRSDFLKKPMLQ
jgi:S1-C subfamily serine protease